MDTHVDLDATLTVSTEMSSYMNTHPKTTQNDELTCSIRALSKEDQMKIETTLNAIVDNISLVDRKAYMERWQLEREQKRCVQFAISTGRAHDFQYANDIHSAARLIHELGKSTYIYV